MADCSDGQTLAHDSLRRVCCSSSVGPQGCQRAGAQIRKTAMNLPGCHMPLLPTKAQPQPTLEELQVSAKKKFHIVRTTSKVIQFC